VLWLVGRDELDDDDVGQLRIEWESRLIPAQTTEHETEMWDEVMQQKSLLT
jgi:hypothetical protein